MTTIVHAKVSLLLHKIMGGGGTKILFAEFHINKLNDSLLPALSWKGDPGKSFLAVGAGEEIW